MNQTCSKTSWDVLLCDILISAIVNALNRNVCNEAERFEENHCKTFISSQVSLTERNFAKHRLFDG